jgi:uncharacterized protein (TIGR02646 family)
MKYIRKGNEPKALIELRANPETSEYQAGIPGLKDALLQEQGHICAYCMGRISTDWNKSLSKPKVEVEHYDPQHEKEAADKNKGVVLSYQNLVGVCNGKTGKFTHCDKSKGNVPLQKLNPLDEKVESLLAYTDGGEIYPLIDKDIEVEKDINLLGLNLDTLKNNRAAVIEEALKRLKDKKPQTDWSKADLEKEISYWKSKDRKGRFRVYCQAAVHFWEKRLKKGRYK